VKSKDNRRRQQQLQQQQQQQQHPQGFFSRAESIGELAPTVVVPDPESADDRAVCHLVNIKERLKMFETLAEREKRERRKQWHSMPSLEFRAKSATDISASKDQYNR